MIWKSRMVLAAPGPLRVYNNSGVCHNSPSLRQISNKMKKISYEPHGNFLLSQIVKNLLWQRLRYKLQTELNLCEFLLKILLHYLLLIDLYYLLH